MAVLSLSETDNKENIPPFSSKNPAFVLTKPSSPSNTKRRLRIPLQDITNLLLPQACSTHVQSDTTQASVSQAKCWKRRAGSEIGSVCKKTCLVYKCGNFR
ncbi:hypothetical protein HRI_001434800 [Hibiscus trionum]|uniref:Uncharacterized protein n=1 Tax=Hibiscus trionum TaxID=183268 RepID=A0A9W7HH73_HIBTR|nr:hypothetical protein HRI_001434800 [Hibiscus trionum]